MHQQLPYHERRLFYLLATVGLFLTEVAIALFVNDRIVRPYIGDLLVVILIYTFCKIFIRGNYFVVAIAVLLFAFFVEGLQYIGLVEKLGLADNKVARTIIGNKFNTIDLLMYFLGFVVVIATEYLIRSRKQPSPHR